MPIPPQPPAIQIHAQLDSDGNWHYPNADQANYELRIQGEAFRAGAGYRPVTSQHVSAPRNLTPQVGNTRSGRTTLEAKTARPIRSGKMDYALGRKKKASFAQVCVCHGPNFTPKRPANAFLIYRTMFQSQLAKAVRNQPSLRGNDSKGREKTEQAAVSALASQWWKEIKRKGEDKQYFELAEKEKKAHAEKFPGYKYEAGKKNQLKWGDESCTCGAFQANEAKERNNAIDCDEGNQYDEAEEEEQQQLYTLAAENKTRKRAPSRHSFEEPPAKRTRSSTLANTARNSGDSMFFDGTAVLRADSHGVNNLVHGEEMNDNTLLFNTAQPSNLFNSPPSRNTRFQSYATSPLAAERTQSIRAGKALTLPSSPPAYSIRSRSRSSPSAADPSIFAPPDFNVAEMTDEDWQAMLEGLEDSGDADHNIQSSPIRSLITINRDEGNQEEGMRSRSSSVDSLFFERDEYATHRRSTVRRTGSKGSSKAASSPTVPYGGRRRSSRRSRG